MFLIYFLLEDASHSPPPNFSLRSPSIPPLKANQTTFTATNNSQNSPFVLFSFPFLAKKSSKKTMNLSSINGVSKTFSDSDQSLDTPTFRSKKKGTKKKGSKISPWKRFKGLGFLVGLLGLFFLFNWWMLYRLNYSGFGPKITSSLKKSQPSVVIKV